MPSCALSAGVVAESAGQEALPAAGGPHDEYVFEVPAFVEGDAAVVQIDLDRFRIEEHPDLASDMDVGYAVVAVVVRELYMVVALYGLQAGPLGCEGFRGQWLEHRQLLLLEEVPAAEGRVAVGPVIEGVEQGSGSLVELFDGGELSVAQGGVDRAVYDLDGPFHHGVCSVCYEP